MWFLGAHADVGGGYAETESRLSDVALQWMMQKMTEVGVRFATPLTRVPNCQCGTQAIHTPWDNSPFNVLAQTPRTPLLEDTFHASVCERWKSDANYRPQALSFLTLQNIDKLTLG